MRPFDAEQIAAQAYQMADTASRPARSRRSDAGASRRHAEAGGTGEATPEGQTPERRDAGAAMSRPKRAPRAPKAPATSAPDVPPAVEAPMAGAATPDSPPPAAARRRKRATDAPGTRAPLSDTPSEGEGATGETAARGAAKAGAKPPLVPFNAIVEQWQRERPDLDPAPMRLFGSLAQAHFLTTPFMNRVLSGYGLARGTFDVLSALRRAGPPFALTPKQLAESLLLSGAGMTNRLDRLEELHLIARLPEPNDRRSLKIQLTHKGVKLVDEIIPKFVQAQWSLVAKLGGGETEMLVDLLRRLADALVSSIDGDAPD